MEISIDSSLTSRSKKWELLHSLWVGWTFTFGFFSWFAFLYIGIRARQRRWVLWGLLYSIPSAYELAARASTTVWPREWDHSWEGTAITLLYPVVMALSIYHALRVRKEYLVRLDSLTRSRARMFATSRGKDWELAHSLWIGWTLALGFLSWVAFLYAGTRVRHLRWKLWGIVYAVPPTLAFLLASDSLLSINSRVTDLLFYVTMVMGLLSIIHALLVRREYLFRLNMVQRETSNVSLTSHGKRWERLQSFWILGTFTFGILSWVSFLYIGIRARRLRWVLWSAFYFAFFLGYAIVASVTGPGSRATSTGVAVLIVIMAASAVHALMVRKDYLTRLEARLQESTAPDAALRNQIEQEYAVGAEPTAAIEGTAAPETTAPQSVAESSRGDSRAASETPPRPVREAAPRPTTAEPRSNLARDERPATESISQDYPLPVAYGWSIIASLWDPRDRYREQLRLTENLLAFLGSTSLAMLLVQDKLAEDFDLKLYWQGGISPGHWRLIIQKATKALAKDNQNPLVEHFRRLNVGSEKKGIGPDIGALIRAKNDYKHDRGPTTEQHLIDASNESSERIEKCIRALSFFKEYPIRLVQDFDVDRYDEDFVLKCLRLTGDGPGFLQERLNHHRALPRGDLFLDLGDQRWVPLYPFVVATNCPRCLYRETYFIDRWDDRKGIALMKSFERGHIVDDKQVADQLTTMVVGHSSSPT